MSPGTGPGKTGAEAGSRPWPELGPDARGGAPRIPLPFLLGEWISDEAAHRRWREQQARRVDEEEKARQAEQERLRRALLRFLAPEPPGR